MRESSTSFAAASLHHVRLRKAFLWLWAIVLAFQLSLSFVPHDHNLADDVTDCITCQVNSHASLALTGTPPAVLAVLLVVAYITARRPDYVSVVPRLYLIPSRQAPPSSIAF